MGDSRLVKYAALGSTGLDVPRVCLGMAFRSGVDSDHMAEVVWRGQELGCNFLDVANVYSDGKCEEVLGSIIKGKRQEFIVTTKVGSQRHDSRPLSRESVLREAEGSLGRLRTDYIDLYLCHEPDPKTPIAETLDAMERLRAQGKIRYAGVSNYSAGQVREALSEARAAGGAGVDCNQVPYSLLNREIEDHLFPLCRGNRVSITVFSPTFIGLLSGAYRFGRPPVPGRSWATSAVYKYEKCMTPTTDRVVREVARIAASHGSTPTQVAMAWILVHPEVTSVITGADSAERVTENVGALDLALTADDRYRLDAASRGLRMDVQWGQYPP